MKNIILFDQDTQHYRQSIYKFFKKEFFKNNYNLVVVYDKKLNKIDDDSFFYIGIDYTFLNFDKIIRKYKCNLIIQFVWLRYKFLLPLMIYNKLRGVKTIVWSHGINLQNQDQPLKNLLYYLRQYLASALIIYTPEQKKYIKPSYKKLFIANNTLDFSSLPKILKSKEELKRKYKLQKMKVILCVARMNTNNRKINHLIELSKIVDESFKIIVIGPGVEEENILKIKELPNIDYLGTIYNQKIISEYYKLAEVFIMPGAIGLALNQAFYYGTPAIIENVDQGPEAYYLKEGINGFYYKKGDIGDLEHKIKLLLNNDNYYDFCRDAKKMIDEEASINKMLSGFLKAIEYVNN